MHVPAYVNPQQPVALPGEAIRLEPSGDVYKVRNIEQMGRIGPHDYGAAASGNSASKSGSTIIQIDDQLAMQDFHLGQFLVNPLSQVEIEIRQTGEQSQRFVNKNQVGQITPYDPPNQRLVWTFGGSNIYAIITNNKSWDMAKTLVYFTGYKYQLGQNVLSKTEVDNLPGSPASVPVDSLRTNPSKAVG